MSGNYKSFQECAQEFIQAMAARNIICREAIVDDGKIHRFAPGGKGNRDAWYIFFGIAGAFGDWSQGISESWSIKAGNLSAKEKQALKDQMENANKKLAGEIESKQKETALVACGKWDMACKTGKSPYLERKVVEAFEIRFQGNSLVIPLRDTRGKLWSLQFIQADGEKRFLSGGRKKGCFHHIGGLQDGKAVYITEGYATGASVHKATYCATVVAFDAGNLDPVIGALKQAYPNSPLIIAGDDDANKEPNRGRVKAEEAARKYGCSVVFPQFQNRESHPTDFNDLQALEGVEEVARQLEAHKTQLDARQGQSCIASQGTDPLPVPNTLLPVLPFTLDMLPEPLQPWVRDIAYRKQCPLDFVAVPAVLMLASLIGANCSLRPHEKDDWTVVPNLWGGILGDPGTLKSPACSEALSPLDALEAKAEEEYADAYALYQAERKAFCEEKNIQERALREIIGQRGDDPDLDDGSLKQAKKDLAKLLKNAPSDPILKRYNISDVTVEKMHEILSQNPKGVLVYRDELMGFLESWEKKGHESDRSFYLESWNGTNSYLVERIGRGKVRIKNVCVSVVGTTQPDKIAAWLQRALARLDNDGLLQRFQLLVYPDKPDWKLVDEFPDTFAKNRILRICETLDTANFCNYGAIEPESVSKGKLIIPYFRFDRQAQTFFHDWLCQLQGKVNGQDHPIISQHLSKYRSLMPSLALIFHASVIADSKETIPQVGITAVEQAAAWCAYLESHARRIYGMALDTTFEIAPITSKADNLLAWMKKQSANLNNQPLKRRFILRHSKFRCSKDLDLILADLVQMGYIAESRENTFCLVA